MLVFQYHITVLLRTVLESHIKEEQEDSQTGKLQDDAPLTPGKDNKRHIVNTIKPRVSDFITEMRVVLRTP